MCIKSPALISSSASSRRSSLPIVVDDVVVDQQFLRNNSASEETAKPSSPQPLKTGNSFKSGARRNRLDVPKQQQRQQQAWQGLDLVFPSLQTPLAFLGI